MRNRAKSTDLGCGTLVLRDIRVRFESTGPWIHDGLSLEVAAGESVAVIGGSGAGKSLLLRVLLGLARPESGEVRVDGLDVVRASETDLYATLRRVGVLFQFGALFDSLTVWENVSFPLRDRGISQPELRRVANEKLKMVGLRGAEDLLPSQLSGGMRKRVGLARAIAHEPAILLCDEPTSGLDPVMSDVISELILQMRDRLGVTTLSITHDMTSAYKIADRIAMLYGGRILTCDSPDGLRSNPDPIVQQFIQGRAVGPIQGTGTSHPAS